VPSLRLVLLIVGALLAGAAAATLAIVLVGGDDKGASETGGTGAAQPVSGPEVRFSGTDVASGETIGLGKLEGKPVVVTVWASWCTECPRQAEALRRFAASHAQTAMLAVDTQEDAEAARAFLTAGQLTIPTIADEDGHVAARLGVRELPTTLFLTSDHRVASMWEGPIGVGRLKAGHAAARAG
jgi:cytochrome c biogenesis protein CcmG, thiol:disulfide interchange protein DsbE